MARNTTLRAFDIRMWVLPSRFRPRRAAPLFLHAGSVILHFDGGPRRFPVFQVRSSFRQAGVAVPTMGMQFAGSAPSLRAPFLLVVVTVGPSRSRSVPVAEAGTSFFPHRPALVHARTAGPIPPAEIHPTA